MELALKRAQVGLGRVILQVPSDLLLLGFGPAAPHGVTPSCVCRDGITLTASSMRVDGSAQRPRGVCVLREVNATSASAVLWPRPRGWTSGESRARLAGLLVRPFGDAVGDSSVTC